LNQELSEKPTAAFVLGLIGGVLDLLVAIALVAVGASVSSLVGGFGYFFVGYGFLGMIWGVLSIVFSVLLYVQPTHHTIYGVFVLLFALLSWLGSFGVLVIGFILGLVGGILGIVWKPSASAAPQPSVTQPLANISRICPSCGQVLTEDAKFCPRCGKSLP